VGVGVGVPVLLILLLAVLYYVTLKAKTVVRPVPATKPVAV
jgi:hypothetical protein